MLLGRLIGDHGRALRRPRSRQRVLYKDNELLARRFRFRPVIDRILSEDDVLETHSWSSEK